MYRHQTHKKNRFGCFVIFLLVLFLPAYVLTRPHQSTAVISPLPDDFTAPRKPFFEFFSKSKKTEDLKNTVKALADEKWKNYSVLVIDLNSDFVMGLNETAIYDAASVNKIPILAALYHAADNGSIDMSKSITIQAKDVQDYGTGSIRYDPPGSVYSVRTLANLMIKKSDNTAAYVLANFVLKLKDIQTYIESLGLTQTNMTDNTTSNKDMGILFTKIFRGSVANTALTAEMTGLLRDTDFEDRLPAQLPEDVTVYHKIGTGVGAVHDAGVVEYTKTKYYIGIFTSDITDEEQTSEGVAAVSKAVFEFMR